MSAEEKPQVSIDFIYSDTCPDCPPARKTVERVTEDMEDVEVNYHKPKDVPDMVTEYGITHVPTIIIDDEVSFVEQVNDKELKDRIEEKL
ncbi:MAG: thioredoxin family protein [Candidatus Thermoplasmatota archaeon]|nr:thioredoxin family protein [Candidatus Thermoplasmatota archaeon]MBS3789601.1 thioredoxin family protein [Candidatus Thermoplasmatota archaeon]